MSVGTRTVVVAILMLFCSAFLLQAGAQTAVNTSSLAAQQLEGNDVPASQLISVLQARPDLLEQVKKVASIQLQNQGELPKGTVLSDEALYSRIEEDSDFREKLVATMRDQQMNGASETTEPARQSDQSAARREDKRQPSAPNGAQQEQTNEAPTRNGNAGLPNSSMEQGHAVNPQQYGAENGKVGNVPYTNLQSLKDLYTQLPAQNAPVKRFGMDIFRGGTGNLDRLPNDLPAGPDYVVGPGDGLTIDIYGGVSQHLTRTVDRSGRVGLPEAGSVVVAGKTLAQAQQLIQDALTPQFRNVRVDVSVAQVRMVRVYVVGEVEKPGAYDVSSLSTPLNALYAAGGPTERGSIRRVKHFRGANLIGEVDLYDMLVRGVRTDVGRIESGDTIMVPSVGPQVTVAGMVRRPAIYELRDEKELADVIELAGGVLVSAKLDHVSIERIQAHQQRVMLSLDIPQNTDIEGFRRAIGNFGVQDGDKVTVYSILPYSNASIYVEGHVFQPGKFAFRKGMEVGDVIRSYKDLLPEPSDRAEIIRLEPPDYRPTAIDFKLSEVLDKSDPITLQPFDTIRIYGRYEVDAPKVAVYGEVLRPGEYPLSQKMTAASLVRMAGGFRRSALRQSADISSYVVENGQKVLTTHETVEISKALDGDAASDVQLKPGDIVTVRRLTGWKDIGAAITLDGEVLYPGTYGIQEGEKLSAVIRRAGGFRSTAYPAGAIMQRQEVRRYEEKTRQELVQKIQLAGMGAKANFAPATVDPDQAGMLQAMSQQQRQVIAHLQSQEASGRLVINISSNISEWENTPNDIEVRPGDLLTIPKRPDFVLVNGQVYNSTAITHVPGKTAKYYLKEAGGTTQLANKGAIFIVRANGAVVSKNGSGFWRQSVMDTRLQPGDAIIVPEKIIGGSLIWKNLLTSAQLLSSLAITARVATSF